MRYVWAWIGTLDVLVDPRQTADARSRSTTTTATATLPAHNKAHEGIFQSTINWGINGQPTRPPVR